MTSKRRIEIFSAGYPICEDTVQYVNEHVCPSCEAEVFALHDPDVAARAALLSIRSIPAVLIDGKLADCCAERGVSIEALRAAGVGTPL